MVNRDVSSASQRSFFGRPFLALSDRSQARYVTHGSSNYLSESCPRIGDVRSLRYLQLAALVQAVGTKLANRLARMMRASALVLRLSLEGFMRRVAFLAVSAIAISLVSLP